MIFYIKLEKRKIQIPLDLFKTKNEKIKIFLI